MKVFVAGATGVLGRALVPELVARGHEVVGMTRSAAKRDLLRSLGSRPVVADALDPDAVAQAVASAEPEVIVHQLTALSGDFDMRHIDRFFQTTNRLRTEGTDHLLAAGRAVGTRRFVAQSFAGWPAARSGGPVKGEDAPFDPDPPEKLRSMLGAIRHLEDAVIGADWTEGVVLRYGGFYGPGTTLSADPAASHTRGHPQAPVPGRRRGRGDLVVHPHRRRRGGDRGRGRARRARRLQRRGRRPCRGAGLDARAGPRAGREAAAARAALARPAAGR